MKRILSLLFFLALSATSLPAQTASSKKKNPPPPPPIPISSLPFTISAPGTYKVTADLSSSTGAIWIGTGIQGPIILDLGGFTISAAGGGDTINNIGILIGGFPGDTDTSNPYPITIQNGTVSNVSYGVWVGAGTLMSDVLIKNLTVNVVPPPIPAYAVGIFMERTQDSTIQNCTINAPPGSVPAIGIKDALSSGGDSYNSITFNNIRQLLDVEPYEFETHAVLNNCSVADPTPTPSPIP